MMSFGRIRGVRYSVLASPDNLAFVNVTNNSSFENRRPVADGIYDPRMGTVDWSYDCATCDKGIARCQGHDGLVNLSYPVVSPLWYTMVRRWLKVGCLVCGSPMFDKEKLKDVPRNARMDKAVNLSSPSGSSKEERKNKICVVCKSVHPKITDEKGDKENIVATYYNVGGQGKHLELVLPVHIIYEIFQRFDADIVEMLATGLNPAGPSATNEYVRPSISLLDNHPKNLIIWRLLVPPVLLRLDSSTTMPNEIMTPEVTNWIVTIFKKNQSIYRAADTLRAYRNITYLQYVNDPGIIAPFDKFRTDLAILNKCVFSYMVGYTTANSSLKIEIASSTAHWSLKKILPGKFGMIRRNAMGVRGPGIRDVIYGDPRARVQEITLPFHIVSRYHHLVCMQPWNEELVRTMVKNGVSAYPGCNEIIKRDGKKYKNNFTEVPLEYGDWVMCNLMQGDEILFNRQPSLAVSSITCHEVRVNYDKNNVAQGFNPLDCDLYNADFDGDAMNGSCSDTPMARAEMRHLMSVRKRCMSTQYSTFVFGFIQDAIVGAYFLTQSRTRISKRNAMQLFNASDAMPAFGGARTYTGRELVEMLLPPGINYRGIPGVADPKKTYGLIPLEDDERKVVIEDSKFKSGILDSSSVGKGNTLLQAVYREYGAQTALTFIYQLQQLAVEYLDMRGLTLSPLDYKISQGARDLIDRRTMAALKQSEDINAKLIGGKIIPPVNMTVEQKFEQIQKNGFGYDYFDCILTGIDPNSNLLTMVVSGARGKVINIETMVAPTRQSVVQEKRPERSFSYWRTGPYSTRYSLDARDNGFVAHSFSHGLNLQEFISHAMADRVNLITKALETAVTGNNTRMLIKGLESVVVNTYRLAMKDKKVIQFMYGMDGYDCTKVEYVVLRHVEISDAEFDARFKPESGDADLYAEYARLKEDRAWYRNIWLSHEDMAMQPVYTAKVLVPMPMSDLVHKMKTSKKVGMPELIKMVKYVRWWCEEHVPYVFFNKMWEEQKGAIPDYVRCAAMTTCMHVREVLNHRDMEKYLNYDTLVNILDYYFVLMKAALIQPGTATGIITAQCVSEPMTQAQLNATHGNILGGQSKGGTRRILELMGVYDTDRVSNSTMTLCLNESEKDATFALSHIAVANLKAFTSKRQIFYEPYGAPVHPTYAWEGKGWIANWEKMNRNVNPAPSNLSRWCFRFELIREMFISKFSDPAELATSIKRAFPNTYCIFTAENGTGPDNIPLLRVYTTENFKNVDKAQVFLHKLLDHNIRGIPGVLSADIYQRQVRYVTDTGALEFKKVPAISSYGTNLAKVARIKAVNINKIQSDLPPEMARLFGIEAARLKLINELGGLISNDINKAHVYMIADEMCSEGKLSKMARAGLDEREPTNTLLRMSNQDAFRALRGAAAKQTLNKMYGVSAPLFLGQVLPIGTNYNELVLKADSRRRHEGAFKEAENAQLAIDRF